MAAAALIDDFFAEIDALPDGGEDDSSNTNETAPSKSTSSSSSSSSSSSTLTSSSSSPSAVSSIIRSSGPISYISAAAAATDIKEQKVQVQVHVEEIDERQMLRGASLHRPAQLIETEAERKRKSLTSATAATTAAASMYTTQSGKVIHPAKPVDSLGVGSFPSSGSAPPPGYSSTGLAGLGAPPGFPGALLASDANAPSAAVKAAAAAAAAKKSTGPKKRKFLRRAAGKVWEDQTLADWADGDHRIFCGDLGNEVNDAQLGKAFSKFATFQRAKVVRDKRTQKTKGYGFVSFGDPFDCANALKELNGAYIGNRPVKLRKSEWGERDLYEQRAQNKEDKKKAKRAKKLVEELGLGTTHNPYI